MLTLALRLFAGDVFRNLAGDVIKGWEWIFSTPVHILEAALALAILWGGWHLHKQHEAEAALPAWQGVAKQWKANYQVSQGNVKTLRAAAKVCTGSVNDAAADSDSRQNSNADRLRQAIERESAARRTIAGLRAEAALRASQGARCEEGDAFKASRGDL